MVTVAVTGATGFVGSNIAEVLAARGHRVVGLTRRDGDFPWEHRRVDYSSVSAIAAALDGVDAVVHCAIANDFHMLVNDRVGAYDAYVGLTKRVTSAASQAGSRVVYISTDWVHDGTGHKVPAELPPNPLNIYGVLKALSEQVVLDLAPDGAIARIGGVMGQHRLQDVGPRNQDVGFGYFVATAVRTIQDGGTFEVWAGDNVNEVATPSLASEIGAGVGRIVERGAAGYFNLVCDDAVTRFELALATCRAFDLDEGRVTQCDVPATERFPAPVPRDTSMDATSTRRALGLKPVSLAETLEAFRRELASGKVNPPTHD